MEGELALAVQRNPGQRAVPVSPLTAFSLYLALQAALLQGFCGLHRTFLPVVFSLCPPLETSPRFCLGTATENTSVTASTFRRPFRGGSYAHILLCFYLNFFPLFTTKQNNSFTQTKTSHSVFYFTFKKGKKEPVVPVEECQE